MKNIISVLITILYLVPFSTSAQDEKLNFTDTDGKKQGRWIKIDEEGKKVYNGNFIDNVPVDTFKYYFKSGVAWSVTVFSKEGTVAYTKMYDITGKITGEGRYINEKRDSLWRFYNQEGKTVATETYLLGKKHGVSVVYFSNGELAEVKHWKDGLLNGDCKRYFDSGQLKDHKIYVNNKVEGIALFYHPSGQIAIEGIYKNDFKNGPWKYYDTNGKLTRTDNYINSKYIGDKDPDVIPKEQVEKERRESEQYEIKNPYDPR